MKRTSRLLRSYLANRGLFARVAKKLGLDPSYISRVANGERKSKRISQAIESELNKIQASGRKTAPSSQKKSAVPPPKKSAHRGRSKTP
jgi:hypothetical protein